MRALPCRPPETVSHCIRLLRVRWGASGRERREKLEREGDGEKGVVLKYE
jgi:hypothetical protein